MKDGQCLFGVAGDTMTPPLPRCPNVGAWISPGGIMCWCDEHKHDKDVKIAAAPDLLEALESALESLKEKAEEARSFWSHGDKFGEAAAAEGIVDSARAAIAKAKGEEVAK